MNFNALSPSTKNLKLAQLSTLGALGPSTDDQFIGVIKTGDVPSALAKQVFAAVKSGGITQEFTLPEFGYLNRISPLSAHYAESFGNVSGRNLEAVVKANGLDGVVIIGGCEVTVLGMLQACLRINCPVLVIPNVSQNIDAMEIGLKQEDIGFWKMLEVFGLCVEGASDVKSGSGVQLEVAFKSGTLILERAQKVHAPKRFLTKQVLQTLEVTNLPGAVMMGQLLVNNGVKLGDDWLVNKTNGLVAVKGSACEDGGIVKMGKWTPPQFSGRAWVYKSLEEADRAISSGQVKEGIVVLQNCKGVDVSIIVHAIMKKELQKTVALATDGYCFPLSVFCVTHCSPSSFENQAFANIQMGDALEIDLAKGRFNTNVASKDMRVREKRGSAVRREMYF